MSHSLLERLRAALAQQYEVERVLGVGGMGTVFLGRDVTLERRVAIKILRPELATATAAERFLREARLLASLSHPNVVPIHTAGEADGVFYYVMDFIEGETLGQRLARGPMSADETVKLGSDLLAALAATHERGVMHRDVKPSNIFLIGDRALLGDFGVAKETGEESPPLTEAGHRVGTPAYMAPEQVEGQATRKSDIYALAMVLYEALTGERWSIATPTDEADFSAVPEHIAAVLRRALALKPGDRWEDAAAFREALTRPIGGRRQALRKWAPLAAALMPAVVALGYWLLTPAPATSLPIRDLAVLPLQVIDWDVPLEGADLAGLVIGEIESAPGVSVVPRLVTFQWWDSASAGAGAAPQARAAQALGARHAAFVTVSAYGDSVEVELEIYDARGDPIPGPLVIGIPRARPQQVSKAIALELVKIELDTVLPSGPRITDNLDALRQYLLGEREFELGRWQPAVEYYEASVAHDTSFMLAWWRLANAWRWLGERGPYEKDFQELFDRYGSDLGTRDSMLMAAQLTPPGPERLRRYAETHERYPLEYFPAYLRGEELFNRGPLWGEPLEHAVAMLEEAVALNPLWAASYVHLIWGNIRLGREQEAWEALERFRGVAPGQDVGWQYPPELLQQAIAERFADPSLVAEGRQQVLGHATFGRPQWVAALARLAGAFDVPGTQVELGGFLVQGGGQVPRALQADGHLAIGLGLVGLGRFDQALASFDAAADLLDSREARLHAAEWRVLPRVIGLDVVDAADVERGRQVLEQLAGSDSVGVRALWALALDAFVEGETSRALRLQARLRDVPPGGGAAPLRELLNAVGEAGMGRHAAALMRSHRLLGRQTATVLLHGSQVRGELLSDPFARSLLHLKRAAWYEAIDSVAAAERELVWYEAVDVLGFPSLEPPQAGEIDWALGVVGRYRRAQLAERLGDRELACRLSRRTAELWQDPSPALVAEMRWAREATLRLCE
jgi:tRNA A-37 threonylcarbamoyl transferase component Bud32/tetratricopeptide (TPR) repeat protein